MLKVGIAENQTIIQRQRQNNQPAFKARLNEEGFKNMLNAAEHLNKGEWLKNFRELAATKRPDDEVLEPMVVSMHNLLSSIHAKTPDGQTRAVSNHFFLNQIPTAEKLMDSFVPCTK